MSKNISFKADIRKKFLTLSIIPLIILAVMLITKIYFTFEQMDSINHKKILKSVDYKLNTFFADVKHKAQFLAHNSPKSLKAFIRLNKELDYIVVLNENGIIQDVASNKYTKLFKGFDYSSKDIYKKFIKTKKPFFSNVYFSNITNKKGIAYIFQNKDKIFIFGINFKAIQSYVQYLKNDTNVKVILADERGNYIFNDLPNSTIDNFFSTDIYKYSVKNCDEFKHIEVEDNQLDSNVFVMYLKNAQTNWYVVTVNKDKIDDAILFIIIWTIIFILGMFIFILIGANKLANSIVKPLELLIDKMEVFANSNNVNKLVLDIQYPLFLKVANSFNKMQKIIIEKRKRIREEVQINKEKDKIVYEQSKMAAMGEMIGNIAHQWRQPLSLISTIASGLLFQKEMGVFEEKRFEDGMNKIVDTTNFLSQTIDDFRDFFKKDKTKTKFFIKDIINKNLQLLEASFKQNHITVETKIEDVELLGFENEFIQAILNILNNAKDALKEQDESLEKYIFINVTKENNKMVLKISDNAGGIPEDIIHRIYEPYFTTKHQAQGTGIGLYMTREIIVKHLDGYLGASNVTFTIDNKKYTGALFTIEIPL